MKLILGADVVPTEQTEKLFVKGDLKTLFGDVCDILKSADRVIVNLECALTDAEDGIKKFGPCLKADPECAKTLKEVGITDALLSNNHVFDFGIKGLRDTVKALDKVGINYAGIGEDDTDSRKPMIITEGGKTVAVVNVCEHEYSYALPNRVGTNPYDPYLTMQDIRDAKKLADFVVVVYHGGKELCKYPSQRLYRLCHEMVHNGADVVLTQHSHCIGCYEEYFGAHIVYGQGNMHFCWSEQPEIWHTSLLVELAVGDRIDIGFIPLVSLGDGIDVAKGEKAREIMSGFEARNAQLLNGEWQAGFAEFCESVAPRYQSVLEGLSTPDTTERQTEFFAHYLDCEAHTDVWRELYKTWNHTNEID